MFRLTEGVAAANLAKNIFFSFYPAIGDMLSRTVDYALRAVIWLAEHPRRPQAAGQLAEATGVSVNYLPKVMQPLIRQRLVNGIRGLHGGYTLARDPAELKVLDVVKCVDPEHSVDRCPRCLTEQVGRLCALHRFLHQTDEASRELLAQASIGDLIKRIPPRNPESLPDEGSDV